MFHSVSQAREYRGADEEDAPDAARLQGLRLPYLSYLLLTRFVRLIFELQSSVHIHTALMLVILVYANFKPVPAVQMYHLTGSFQLLSIW